VSVRVSEVDTGLQLLVLDLVSYYYCYNVLHYMQ